MAAPGQEDRVAGLQDQGLELVPVVVEELDPDPAREQDQDLLRPEDLALDQLVAVPLDDLALRMDEQAELLGELAGSEEVRPGLVEFLAEDDGVDLAVAGDFESPMPWPWTVPPFPSSDSREAELQGQPDVFPAFAEIVEEILARLPDARPPLDAHVGDFDDVVAQLARPVDEIDEVFAVVAPEGDLVQDAAPEGDEAAGVVLEDRGPGSAG